MPENTLSFPGTTGTAANLYIERNGQYWNGTAFAAIVNANWTTYALLGTEQGTTGVFIWTVPATLPAAPKYGFIVRQRAGAGAAPTDSVLGSLVASWNGTDLGTVTVDAYATGKAPLQPTVAGRTLDVTATGAAGIDWANVENPTTAVNLSGTTISASQTTIAELPEPPPAGYGDTPPAGTTPVTQDTGGTDALKVNDSAGQPIFGALVSAYLASAYAANPAAATTITDTTTDVNGHWTLHLPVNATYTLVFMYPGDRSATANVTT